MRGKNWKNITKNTNIPKCILLRMSEVVFLHGKWEIDAKEWMFKENRKVTLPYFPVLTDTGRNWSRNKAAIEKTIKSSGNVAGFTSMRLKRGVVNVYLEKWQNLKRINPFPVYLH